MGTGHLFHSLYAYIPAVASVEKERKQIRLSEDCIYKLFVNTTNDFKLYAELYAMIANAKNSDNICPCQLLIQRRDEIKLYVDTIGRKKFDNKPPKFKKETIDNIMYKYSLNWKNLLMKRKTCENQIKNGGTVSLQQHATSMDERKKRKIKKRTILTDEYIYFDNFNTKQSLLTKPNNVDGADNANSPSKLHPINGMSLNLCRHHDYVVSEEQLRAGDEAVSFVRRCRRCHHTNIKR